MHSPLHSRHRTIHTFGENRLTHLNIPSYVPFNHTVLEPVGRVLAFNVGGYPLWVLGINALAIMSAVWAFRKAYQATVS